MRNVMGGSAGPDLAEFGGFEQRLLDDLKLIVAEGWVDVTDPVQVARPGWSPLRMPGWRRAGLVAAAGLAAGAVAIAGLFAGGVLSGRPVTGGGGHIELTTFLARAASAARSAPVALPKPGQVFVERVRTGETGPKTDNKVRCYLMAYDTPATGRAAYPTKTGPCGTKLTRFLIDAAVVARVGGGGSAPKADHHPHGYPDPARLPTRPAALLAALNRAANRGHWGTGAVALGSLELDSSPEPHNAIVFGLIERLLQVPIRPALRAALFEVTGHLPGVRLDRHAADLIGRPGVGIALPQPINASPDGIRLEFVLSPKSYQFLGVAMTDSIDGNPANPAKYGYAVIKSKLITPKTAKN
jgi:hypothetical protein